MDSNQVASVRVGPTVIYPPLRFLLGQAAHPKFAAFFCSRNCLLPHAPGMTGKTLWCSSLIGIALLSITSIFWTEIGPPWPASSRSDARSLGPTDRSITVAFWNMQWFPGGHPHPSRSEKFRQIGSVRADMARFNPDIFGMEEVRDFKNATMAVKPWPGFKVDVCANFPPREGNDQAQEVAIASRLQPLSAWAEQWKPNGALVPPRGFAFAAYQLAPDRLLLFYAVHLKSNLGEIAENIAIREESMRQLGSHMAAMEQAYGRLGRITWAVGGDCNTSLDDQQFAAETTLRRLIDNGFVWCWRNVSPRARVTLPPDKGFPPACFDHIFVRGAAIRKAWVVRSSPHSSDHRPVVAVLDM
jgi:endonuclease/exonuclease/phosphatase family metal-dependent hydrolase